MRGAPWAEPPDAVLAGLGSSRAGLTTAEAARRRTTALPPARRHVGRILAAQFLNPLVLLLLAAAAIAFPLGSYEDGIVILAIVALSGGLGFVREYRAENAVAKLLAGIRTTATVRRDGRPAEVPLAEVVPGDVVLLSAGATLPGDGRLVEVTGLQVDESALTGESFPAEKQVEPVPADAPLPARASAAFLGTHVVSGTAEVAIVAVGADTELGRIRGHLERPRPATEFELGMARFGNLLVRSSAILVAALFAINVALHRPLLDAFLFAVALAVGLVPELLPAIVTTNLAHGATRMGAAGVVVKRLAAIEDLGSVDVLCSDKTGTLTVGQVRLHDALGVDGARSDRVLELAWLNATFESGYANPIDRALREARPGAATDWTADGEVPYDFTRRRLTVAVARGGERIAITKGQLRSVLSACTAAEGADGRVVPLDPLLPRLAALHDRLAREGYRTLGVAWRPLPVGAALGVELERELVFAGVLALADPPRTDARPVLEELRHLGIALVVVTGDDRRVASQVWRALHDTEPTVLTGPELRTLGTEALERRVVGVSVFAEVLPIDKERVVHALRRTGRVVAYLGDGINDAPALRAADVGLTVDGAADVAREAADIVLQRASLGVIAAGVREGRRTVYNSLKYVYYTTAANFGNMLSMAAASAFLPFLPLLPKQILLNNFLSDVPAMAIAADRVDEEQLARPGRWDARRIRSFMLVFGAISSVFDAATFLVLHALVGELPVVFRTAWFAESLLTELLVLFVMRTHRPMWQSRPSPAVTGLTVGVAGLTLLLVIAPIGGPFGLAPLPAPVLGAILAITGAYVGATEVAKRWFFRDRAQSS